MGQSVNSKPNDFLGWPNFYMCQKLKGFYGKAWALAEFLVGVSIVRYPHILFLFVLEVY